MSVVVFLVSCQFDRGQQLVLERTANWSNACYLEFESDIKAIAPSTAKDCGFSFLQDVKAGRGASIDCARRSEDAGKLYIVGFQYIGEDSLLCAAGIRLDSGEYIELLFDSDVTGQMGTGNGRSALYINRCKGIEFYTEGRSGGAGFDLADCVEANDLEKKIFGRFSGH